MSGGHLQYVGARLRADLESIAEDERIVERWPRLAALLGSLAPILAEAEHEMDYDLSGDSGIVDDPVFEDRVCHAILDVAMRAAADSLFPRGKWATIQASQGRMGGDRA